MTPHWYHLVTENGTAMGSDMVRLPPDSYIADFRKQVKAENTNDLGHVDAKNLTVYLNMAAYENRETVAHLEEDLVVSGYGDSKKNSLIVVVSNKTQGIKIG